MANAKHLAVRKEGVEVWNRWRAQFPDIKPDISGVNLRRADFMAANLGGVNLSGCDLSEADLRQATLIEADLMGADLTRANLERAKLTGAQLNYADMSNARLIRADLSRVDLARAKLVGASLRGAKLTGAKLALADFAEADFMGADLTRADLEGAVFVETILEGATLCRAKLQGATLVGINLRGCDLSEADLRQATLVKATLEGANFQAAQLTNANLGAADLRGADFGRANLSKANLTKANLSKADLRVVNAQFATLDGANLTDARLWETLRAGWSIKGVICERAFWDKEGVEATVYAPGEFEKLYSEGQLIELIYADGMTRFELDTLPALIHQLEKLHQGARLRLKSVEEAAGGAKVSVVVEDVDEAGLWTLQNDARELQAAQLELRDERKLRERLAIQNALLLDEVFPRILVALPPRQIVATASGGSTIVVESSHVHVTSHQTVNDLEAIKSLVDKISVQRTELGLPGTQIARLEEGIQSVREELKAAQPKTSVLREALNSVRNVLEGAVGSTIAAAGREHWTHIVVTLSQLLQRLQ